LSTGVGMTDEANERGIRINNRKVVRYLSGEKAGFGSFYIRSELTDALKTLKVLSGAPMRS